MSAECYKDSYHFFFFQVFIKLNILPPPVVQSKMLYLLRIMQLKHADCIKNVIYSIKIDKILTQICTSGLNNTFRIVGKQII